MTNENKDKLIIIMAAMMSDTETRTEKTLLLSNRLAASKNSSVSSQYTSCSDDETVRRKPTIEDELDTRIPRIHNEEEVHQEGQCRNPEFFTVQFPLSKRCCLPCTRSIQKHRRLCYVLFVIALTFCAIVIAGLIGVGLYLSEGYSDKPITLQIPPKTTYEYKLKDDEITHLVYHKGMTVTIHNYSNNSGLVLVALSNRNLLNEGKDTEPFQHRADPESTIVRYWRNSIITGGIQCTGDISIVAENISSIGDIETPDCSNTDNAIECSDEKIDVSTIISNMTGGSGDLTAIRICSNNNSAVSSANFSFREPLHVLAGIPIYQLDSVNQPIRIGYREFASTIANQRPALYVSTQYVQYDAENESVLPIVLKIEFEETFAYIVSFIVIGFLVFLTLLLLVFCYYKNSDKQSCTLGCSYYPK